MIPTTVIHHITYLLPQHQQLAMSQSFWLCTEHSRLGYTPALYVYRYDPQIESVREIIVGSTEYNNYYSDVQHMQYDSGLAPYPYHTYQQWLALTSCIDQHLVTRLQSHTESAPVSTTKYKLSDKQLTAASQRNNTESQPNQIAVATTSSSSTSSTTSKITQKQPPTSSTSTTIHFTPLPQKIPTFDKTPTLIQLLQQSYNNNYKHLLGELQFSFIELLISYNLTGLEQWRNIIELLCSSDSAIEVYPQLYIQFLSTLTAQLPHLPIDYFTDPLSSGLETKNLNFLQHYLQALDSIVRDTQNIDRRVVEGMMKLKVVLEKRFKLMLDVVVVGEDDEDEHQPTVVELSDEQMKMVEAAEKGGGK